MSETIEHGYNACAGVCRAGWYGGVLVLEDRDAAFVGVPEHWTFEQRAAHARRWVDVALDTPRQVVLVRPAAAHRTDQHVLASAPYVEGPVCPRETPEAPVLAWVECRDGLWRLMLHSHGTTRVVRSSSGVIRCVRVALTADGLLLAFETDDGPRDTRVVVVDSHGDELHSMPGRRPLLCAAGGGYCLATEQASANAVRVRLDYVKSGAVTVSQDIEEGDYLLNADMAWSDRDKALIVAAASSPCFGYSNQLGLHRSLHAWRWALTGAPEALGVLPIEQRAFRSIGPENLAPVKPKVLSDAHGLAIVFKQHRYFAFKTFGWDLFWSRREEEQWSEAVRISPELTTSDTDFGIVPVDGHYLGLFPGHTNGGGPSRSTDRRVQVLTFGPDCRLDRFEVSEDRTAEYRIPAAYRDIAPEPPELPRPYDGRQLIWGDLHIHTTYSKCVSAVDGDPEENIRYARQVLGCRVVAIAEHTRHTTGPESTWLYDRLEAMTGNDNVFLYASEPGLRGMRHTNWYARDRETMQKLERIIISHGHGYHDILRQVREELPADSVLVLRHFHGQAIPDEQILQHFDPHFEVAMEAMQGRCNAMIDPREGASAFPNAFLDAGCKIGLVGGTDHFRFCPNHFCLTGFWVKDVTAAGVWEALRNRYTIAMSDSKVALATRCNGAPMGSSVTLEPDDELRVSLQAACARPIRRVTLMRDGELLPWTDVDATTVAIDLVDRDVAPGRHWYVPTVEVATAYGTEHTGICHGSPYFVFRK